MNYKSNIVIALGCIVAFSSCKKEEEEMAPIVLQPTVVELLTSQIWTISALTESVNNGPIVDLFDQIDTCERDNEVVFTTDFQVQVTDGAIACDPDEPYLYESNWSLNEAQDSIMSNSDYDAINFISSTQFVVSQTFIDGTNTTITETTLSAL